MSQPALPIETWRSIFYWSTHVPGLLDTSIQSPLHFDEAIIQDYRGGEFTSSLQDFDIDKLESDHLESLETKKAISLVCKAWREVSVEFLFESLRVSVNGYEDQTLYDDLPASFLSPNSLFQHVRHLTINGSSRWRFEDDIDEETKRRSQRAIRILDQCTNLHICTTRIPGRDPSVLTYLLTHRARSLRRLEVCWGILDEDFPRLLSQSVPQLESLSLGCRCSFSQGSTFALPALHTLHLRTDFANDFQPRFDTPRLQHCNLHMYRRCDTLLPVLQVIPSHISTLELPNPDCITVQQLLDLFPKLETLVWIPPDDTPWDSLRGSFSFLREVGVKRHYTYTSGCNHMIHNADVKESFGVLASRRDLFPSIKVIWCCDFDPPSFDSEEKETWSHAIIQASKNGVTLRSRDGRFF